IVCSKDNEEMVSALGLAQVSVVRQGTDGAGMAGAVLTLANDVHGETLILNASDIFDFTVFFQYRTMIEKNAPDFIFLAKQTAKYFPGAYAVFSNEKVTGFIEKPDPEKVPSDTLKLVADYFSDFHSFTQILVKTQTQNDNQYEEAINGYLKQNIRSEYVLYEGQWFALKYSWDLLSMMRYYLSEIKEQFIDTSASVSKTAIITGPVHVGKQAKIGDFVKITGPCYIGDNTIVGDYSLVRESHIGSSCLVGSSSEVARSYVGDGVMLHRNYIGDSVLDRNALLGAGAVTANFRFDGKQVHTNLHGSRLNTHMNKFGVIIGALSKIGVNTTLFPGVKIGSNSQVAPGQQITKDIEDSVFYWKKNEHNKK
ncbi:MAG: hypothetical protein WC489_04595, partial [Patescibacteria group bacterium]